MAVNFQRYANTVIRTGDFFFFFVSINDDIGHVMNECFFPDTTSYNHKFLFPPQSARARREC